MDAITVSDARHDICYGCWFRYGYQKGCGCIIDPKDKCLESDDGQHEWDKLMHGWYEEGEHECIGLRCELCGVQDIA